MKYGIWRHENALGNSGEHTNGVAKHLKRLQDADPMIYVEKEFQRIFAMCIPGITPERIRFFDEGIYDAVMKKTIVKDKRFNDIHMPNVYDVPGMKTYPASWADLSHPPDCTLRFPHESYDDKHHLPREAIVIQVREANTFWKRHTGSNEEPLRSVEPETFFKAALHFAEQGYQVVRLGDKNQKPFPKHKNILDFALVEDRTMMDDLYLISQCKVFLSCDSGIWPIAGGMKKNLVLSNVTSIFGARFNFKMEKDGIDFVLKKSAIVDWLNPATTRILVKKVRFAPRGKTLKYFADFLRSRIQSPQGQKDPRMLLSLDDLMRHAPQLIKNKSAGCFVEIMDNSFEELVEAVESFL